MAAYRIEKDTLGKVRVPRKAYYGAQTQRAVENFPISGLRFQSSFIRAQAVIKLAAARANQQAGSLDRRIADAIVQAADEVLAGKFRDQFVLDIYQAGAGTSQNMNMNEVLANRAEQILGGRLGAYALVHPNDHVNMGQSTNDTIHTAIHIAAVSDTTRTLLPSVRQLEEALRDKARAFDRVIKTGRTHLQDAVPMRLGQEFGGWAAMLRLSRRRVESSLDGLRELCLGGTAVGTGLNAPRRYRGRAIRIINKMTGEKFRPAPNRFESMQSLDAVLALSGSFRVLATGLKKIADDIRLLGSGPRTGLAELRLPAVQPGSSIMPGKVNPVMAEMLNMVCAQVTGCDATILHSAHGGQLQLNVMMPVVAYNVLHAAEILGSGVEAFTERCVRGIEANEEICRAYAERSGAIGTALSPRLGYDEAAELAKEALEKDVTIRELAEAKGLLDKAALERILNLRRMTEDPEKS